MLNFIKYINLVNDRYIIFKIYYIIKYNYYIFEIKKKAEFIKSEKITTVKISL